MTTPSDPSPVATAHDGPSPIEVPSERRRPRLVSIHGAQMGKRWVVEACGIVIGRDPARAGLVLPDPAISARHCAVEHDPATGEFRVSDLGSRNGTFVNGEKIGERRLCDGDKLFVGETVLAWSLDDELGKGFHSGVESRVDLDALTGLLVKRAFDLELARAFAQARDFEKGLSLLMMDVGEYETIDPDRSRKTSALCVAEIGRIIGAELVSAGRACRFGGDRFIALLHPAEREAAWALAERICARVSAYTFERHGAPVHSMISIGIAELGPELPTPDHLLQVADEACFRARRAGRTQVSR